MYTIVHFSDKNFVTNLTVLPFEFKKLFYDLHHLLMNTCICTMIFVSCIEEKNEKATRLVRNKNIQKLLFQKNSFLPLWNKENLISYSSYFSNFSHFIINIIISYLFFSYNQGNVTIKSLSHQTENMVSVKFDFCTKINFISKNYKKKYNS